MKYDLLIAEGIENALRRKDERISLLENCLNSSLAREDELHTQRSVAARGMFILGKLHELAIHVKLDPDKYLATIQAEIKQRHLSGAAAVEYLEHVYRGDSRVYFPLEVE
jgi:hypothetical protein